MLELIVDHMQHTRTVKIDLLSNIFLLSDDSFIETVSYSHTDSLVLTIVSTALTQEVSDDFNLNLIDSLCSRFMNS